MKWRPILAAVLGTLLVAIFWLLLIYSFSACEGPCR